MSLMTARDFWNTYQSAGGRAVLKGTRAAPERWLINVRAAAPGQGGTLYLCHESQRVPMRISDRSIVLPSKRVRKKRQRHG